MSIRLCDLIIAQEKSKIKAGEGKTKGDYKFFTSSNIQTKYVDFFQYDKPALIFGTGGMPSIHYCDEPFSTSTDCIVFYAKNNRYSLKSLYLFFESHMNLLEEGFHGAGLQHISKKYLLDIQIPDIPIEQQLKINNIGDKLNRLIDIRKNQLENYNSIVKSRFIEMFGDPVLNTKKWNTDTIENLCSDIYGGGTPSKFHPEYYEKANIVWISSKDMKTNNLNDSQIKINQLGVDNSTAKMVPTNSVIMVIRSGILKHTLPVAINTVPITINQDLKAFIPNKKILSVFLMFLFKMLEKEILTSVRAVTADNIEFNSLKQKQIIVPPSELQEQFSDFAKQIDKSKFECSISLNLLKSFNFYNHFQS